MVSGAEELDAIRIADAANILTFPILKRWFMVEMQSGSHESTEVLAFRIVRLWSHREGCTTDREDLMIMQHLDKLQAEGTPDHAIAT